MFCLYNKIVLKKRCKLNLMCSIFLVLLVLLLFFNNELFFFSGGQLMHIMFGLFLDKSVFSYRYVNLD
jgi:hypothetical protein